MMIKFVTLAVLPMAAMAKMRGEKTYGAETMLFPLHGHHHRQLMDDMGGGDDGDCPDSGDAPERLCRSNSDCDANPYCDGKEGCCCIAYTYPYCGVPDCNDFQYCLPDDDDGGDNGGGNETDSAVPELYLTAEQAEDAFTVLTELQACLAEEAGDASRQLFKDGCPESKDYPEYLCRSSDDCTSICEGQSEDCCCVAYTVPYCGVPQECNDFLQCIDGNATIPDPELYVQSTETDAQWELLNTLSACLATTEETDSSAPTTAVKVGFGALVTLLVAFIMA